MRKLGLKGAIINSHTHGEYLDDPKVLGYLRGGGITERSGVPASHHAVGAHDRADSSSAAWMAPSSASPSRPACTCCGSSSAASSTVSPSCRWWSATWARAYPIWLFRIDFMHARMWQGQPLPGRAEAEAGAQRVPQGECLRHHQRHGVGTADPLRAIGDWEWIGCSMRWTIRISSFPRK